MADIAVTHLMLPAADLPAGECVMTRLDDGTIRIDHADPRILVSGKLLPTLYVIPTVGVSLSLPPLDNGFPREADYWEGAVLRIDGVNRTVIYRIGEYVPRVHGYIAEWPD